MRQHKKVTSRNTYLIKRFIDAKKFYQNAQTNYMGNMICDDLGALENMYQCVRGLLSVIMESMNISFKDYFEYLKDEVDAKVIIALKKSVDDKKIIDIDSINFFGISRSKALIILLDTLNNKLEKEYDISLTGYNQILLLFERRYSVRYANSMVHKDDVFKIKEQILVLLKEISDMVFGISYKEMEYHHVISDDQLKETLGECNKLILEEDYKEAIKRSSLAFSISLESQRHRLNYLMENEELNTSLFSLDSERTLYYKLQDYSFILLALQVNLKKYRLFIKIVPTTMIDDNSEEGVSITISDFVHSRWIGLKWARFCYNFVVETILQWESMDLKYL